MLHGRYHPVTMSRLVGAFDASGNLVGLHMRISGQSILAGLNPQGLQNGRDPATFQGLNPSGTEGVFGYAVPNLLIDHAMRNPPVPPGFWRGVNNNQNALYLECFMDELAHAAGQDPLDFRRQLLANSPKHLAVLNAVAEKAGWGTAAGKGRLPRPVAAHGLRQLRCRLRRGLGERRRLGEDPAHRRRDRSRPRGQSAADRGAGRRLLRLRSFGDAATARSRSRTARSSRRISTPIRSCAWTRCRRSRRS